MTKLASSIVEQLLELSPEERRKLVMQMSEDDALAALYDWEGLWARPQQREPKTDPAWLFWLNLGGRGAGKTRIGAEFVCRRACEEMPGSRGFIAGRTLDDVRLTCIEGDSGVLACLHPAADKKWNRTTCELTIRAGDRGTSIKGFTSEKPAAGRGPQHHWGWADELAAWLKEGDLWDQLVFGLRLPWPGRPAQAVITTTPLPIERIRDLVRRDRQLIRLDDGREYLDVVVSRMTTYDNLANLSAATAALIKKYEGTRLGRQELLAELLDDTQGALWRRGWFDRVGFRVKFELEDFDFIWVAIDPAITAHQEDDGDSDYTGITAGGRLRRGAWLDATGKADTERDHYGVLADWSMRAAPQEWAKASVELFHQVKADMLVGETNRGGDLVEAVVRQVWDNVPFIGVSASRGKRTRAEPIATIYEQGRYHHALEPQRRASDEHDFSTLIKLEDQLVTWVPSLADSPDRLDSLVWGGTAAIDGARFFGT